MSPMLAVILSACIGLSVASAPVLADECENSQSSLSKVLIQQDRQLLQSAVVGRSVHQHGSQSQQTPDEPGETVEEQAAQDAGGAGAGGEAEGVPADESVASEEGEKKEGGDKEKEGGAVGPEQDPFLSDAGFKSVAMQNDAKVMLRFVKRVAEHLGLQETSKSDGVLLKISGKHIGQDSAELKTLTEEILEAGKQDKLAIIVSVKKGKEPPLNENGYKITVQEQDEGKMVKFIERAAKHEGYKITDQNALSGVAPFYNGVQGLQTYADLQAEFKKVSKEKKGWAKATKKQEEKNKAEDKAAEEAKKKADKAKKKEDKAEKKEDKAEKSEGNSKEAKDEKKDDKAAGKKDEKAEESADNSEEAKDGASDEQAAPAADQEAGKKEDKAEKSEDKSGEAKDGASDEQAAPAADQEAGKKEDKAEKSEDKSGEAKDGASDEQAAPAAEEGEKEVQEAKDGASEEQATSATEQAAAAPASAEQAAPAPASDAAPAPAEQAAPASTGAAAPAAVPTTDQIAGPQPASLLSAKPTKKNAEREDKPNEKKDAKKPLEEVAPFNQDAFQAVVQLNSKVAMSTYVHRLIDALGLVVTNGEGMKKIECLDKKKAPTTTFFNTVKLLLKESKKRVWIKSMIQPRPGDKAELSEEGYRAVVEMQNNDMMELFIKRVIEADKLHLVGDKGEGGVSGMAPYYSGVIGFQDFSRLKTEIKEKSNDDKVTWLAKGLASKEDSASQKSSSSSSKETESSSKDTEQEEGDLTSRKADSSSDKEDKKDSKSSKKASSKKDLTGTFKRYDDACYYAGNDVASRDATCVEGLKCARKGFDGRDYGDCPDHNCCSKVPKK